MSSHGYCRRLGRLSSCSGVPTSGNDSCVGRHRFRVPSFVRLWSGAASHVSSSGSDWWAVFRTLKASWMTPEDCDGCPKLTPPACIVLNLIDRLSFALGLMLSWDFRTDCASMAQAESSASFFTRVLHSGNYCRQRCQQIGTLYRASLPSGDQNLLVSGHQDLSAAIPI